jgi:hypothetical protein
MAGRKQMDSIPADYFDQIHSPGMINQARVQSRVMGTLGVKLTKR